MAMISGRIKPDPHWAVVALWLYLLWRIRRKRKRDG